MKTKIMAVSLAATILNNSPAAADDRCFVEGSSYDICEYAKKIQAEAAPELPVAISSDLTFDAVLAEGPKLILGVRWASSWEQLQARMELNGKNLGGMSVELQDVASKAVCSSQKMRAFVILGGVIAYAYRSSDGHNIYTATVSECEAN